MKKSFRGVSPRVPDSAYVAETAVVIGDVEIGANVNIWYGVTVRGDINRVIIGENTNIQENTVIHVDRPAEGSSKGSCEIGSNVTVGHMALLHACRVEDNCLIGMSSTVLSGAVIGEGSIVAAGALVLEKAVIPPRSLVVGIPGKVIGTVSDERLSRIVESAKLYVELGNHHRAESHTLAE